jgi:hypothetical protein
MIRSPTPYLLGHMIWFMRVNAFQGDRNINIIKKLQIFRIEL